jgi:hypothetical protein
MDVLQWRIAQDPKWKNIRLPSGKPFIVSFPIKNGEFSIAMIMIYHQMYQFDYNHGIITIIQLYTINLSPLVDNQIVDTSI